MRECPWRGAQGSQFVPREDKARKTLRGSNALRAGCKEGVRLQIISQQIHVNFYQDGINDHLLTFALVFAKITFGSREYSGFSQSSPLFNGKHLCVFFFIFSVVFVILYIYLELRRKTSFSQDLSPEEAPGGRQSQRCEPVAKKSSTEHIYKYI